MVGILPVFRAHLTVLHTESQSFAGALVATALLALNLHRPHLGWCLQHPATLLPSTPNVGYLPYDARGAAGNLRPPGRCHPHQTSPGGFNGAGGHSACKVCPPCHALRAGGRARPPCCPPPQTSNILCSSHGQRQPLWKMLTILCTVFPAIDGYLATLPTKLWLLEQPSEQRMPLVSTTMPCWP